jgi:ElaB/YqjD/DUF883 family membrane-anchored ribosome-binding protein
MPDQTPGTVRGHTGSSMDDKTSENLSNVTEQVVEKVKSISHKAYEVGEQVEERAEDVLSSVANTMKQHPLGTLAIAAGLAFAVGALWKIRSASRESRVNALLAHLPTLPSRQSILPRRWRG